MDDNDKYSSFLWYEIYLFRKKFMGVRQKPASVELHMELYSNGRLLALPANIKLGLKLTIVRHLFMS